MTATPYLGVHCETTATGTLLGAVGCDLPEALLFGLGEAFGFVYLNLSSLPLGFLGGRSKPFDLTEAACRNLGLTCTSTETTSTTRSWERLVDLLADGPVGLQLDCYYLPDFEHAPHCAGHFVAATGLDGDVVDVVDTVQQGTQQRVARDALQAARHARGPMSAKARTYTISGTATTDLGAAVLSAIKATATSYLSPAFAGIGAQGIAKVGKILPRWAGSPAEDLRLMADLMERAGTGGALFRNLYRDFLDEAASLVPRHAPEILEARDHIATSAQGWTRIADLLERCADDGDAAHLIEAAALCGPIAEAEVAAMRILADL